MFAELDRIDAADIVKASIESRFQIPFFSSYVQAGIIAVNTSLSDTPLSGMRFCR
nr:hypothetical protein [Arsenicibacter rosenii]